MHQGHTFEMLAIAGVFGLILLPNIIRMWWYIILKPDIKAPVSKYFTRIMGVSATYVHTKKSSGL